jgi:hypothetical protein
MADIPIVELGPRGQEANHGDDVEDTSFPDYYATGDDNYLPEVPEDRTESTVGPDAQELHDIGVRAKMDAWFSWVKHTWNLDYNINLRPKDFILEKNGSLFLKDGMVRLTDLKKPDRFLVLGGLKIAKGSAFPVASIREIFEGYDPSARRVTAKSAVVALNRIEQAAAATENIAMQDMELLGNPPKGVHGLHRVSSRS